MTVYNVAVFGAVADGVTLCTKAVQAAVDTCHKNGGGIVQFDGGRYVLSTVFLKDNVQINIPENAEILGSLNFYDFAQQEAIDYAKKVAGNQEGYIVIHKKDGSFRKLTY